MLPFFLIGGSLLLFWLIGSYRYPKTGTFSKGFEKTPTNFFLSMLDNAVVLVGAFSFAYSIGAFEFDTTYNGMAVVAMINGGKWMIVAVVVLVMILLGENRALRRLIVYAMAIIAMGCAAARHQRMEREEAWARAHPCPRIYMPERFPPTNCGKRH